MQERNTQQYNKAIDALEMMLNQSNANTKVTDKAMRGFNHILCESMKDAFKNGMDGRQKPDVITALRNMGMPIATATASVIETAYHTGIETRGE